MGVNDVEPGDPEPGPRSSSAHPAYRSPRLLAFLAMIAAGGAAGTSLRAVIEQAFAVGVGGWPWATLSINVSGAFVLGFLLEALACYGADSGWRRSLRLTAGTGLLGGYTTYSTFAVEVTQLLDHASYLTGLAYAVTSLALGPAAAAAGYLAADKVLAAAGGER